MVNKSPRKLIVTPQEWSIAQLQEALADALNGSGPALSFGTTAHDHIAEEIAVVISTSGSTGHPKEVALTAAALRASANASHSFLGAHKGDRWSLLLPTSHIAGVNVLIRAITLGTQALDFRDAEIREQAEFTSIVPTQLYRALHGEKKLLSHLQGSRAVLVGGAATPQELIEKAISRGINIVTTYGMSEMSGGCVYNNQPIEGVDVRVDGAGVISLRGAMQATTYLGAEEIWQSTTDGPWFVTSDMGELRDGKLYVHGRIDDQIISGGEKISLTTIEQELNSTFPDQKFMTFSIPDLEWGSALCLASDREIDRLKIRALLSAKFGSYCVPKEYLSSVKLPYTSIGKPDRLLLRRALQESRSEGMNNE